MVTEHADRPDADATPDTGHEHGATHDDAPDTVGALGNPDPANYTPGSSPSHPIFSPNPTSTPSSRPTSGSSSDPGSGSSSRPASGSSSDPGSSSSSRPASGSSSDPGPASGSGSGDRDFATPSPGKRGGRRWGGLTRWLLIGGATFVVVLLVLVGTITYGAARLIHATDARNDASDRFGTACEQLETRLNRLIPPGATRGPDERATAIRGENVAVQPLLDELHGLPDDVHTYDTVRTDWQALVSAREKFASELDAGSLGERPAFFVVPRDDGADRIKRIFDQSPRVCDASVRRLAAPDL